MKGAKYVNEPSVRYYASCFLISDISLVGFFWIFQFIDYVAQYRGNINVVIVQV